MNCDFFLTLHWPYWYCIDEFDAFIIVSFPNATLVLSIGETVEEVMDSGFLGTTPTLGCAQMGDNTLVQVLLFVQHCRLVHYNT